MFLHFEKGVRYEIVRSSDLDCSRGLISPISSNRIRLKQHFYRDFVDRHGSKQTLKNVFGVMNEVGVACFCILRRAFDAESRDLAI